MCALLVGLPDVNLLGVEVSPQLRVHVETTVERPRCGRCGTVARVKDRPVVELVDLPCFGNPARLVWHKRRWCCPNEELCGGVVAEDDRIVSPVEADGDVGSGRPVG